MPKMPAAVIIVVLFIAIPAAGGDLVSFLPWSGEVGGWTTYQWPRDESGLYWLIDGAGMVYIEHGFHEAVFQRYYDASRFQIEVEIYDLDAAANAESTYHDPALQFGWEAPRDDFGTEGRVDTLGLATYRGEFWRDRYFTRITVFQKNSHGFSSLISFCQLVDEKLMGSAAAGGLPANGEVTGWNRYLIVSDSLSLISVLEDDAGPFMEWGCQQALRQNYYEEGFVRLAVELFDMNTAGNAQSLYHDARVETGLEVPRDDFGQEGRLDATSSWTYQACFWRKQYLARITVEEKSDTALADLAAFCRLVDQNIAATSVDERSGTHAQLPARWQLPPVFPNPFNDSVLIRYRIPESRTGPSGYDLSIYNVRGQKVKTLISQAASHPGTYEVRWDGRDDGQQPLASGIYFCRLRYGQHMQAAKLILCR